MATILHSERLHIRSFEVSDAEFLLELVNGKDFIRFIGNKNMHTIDDATTYIKENYQKSYIENGFGFWLVELAETGKPIGGCGILKRANLSTPDIGYAFLPQFVGRGFAIEAARAVFEFGKIELKIETIAAIVDPDNMASRKLLEKLGLKYKADVILDGDLKKLMLYIEPHTLEA